MSKVSTITPEEESKFWERVGDLLGVEESPVEETVSYICYDSESETSGNKS